MEVLERAKAIMTLAEERGVPMPGSVEAGHFKAPSRVRVRVRGRFRVRVRVRVRSLQGTATPTSH